MNSFKKQSPDDSEKLLGLNLDRKHSHKGMFQIVTLITCILAIILGGVSLYQAIPTSAHSTSSHQGIIYLENQKPESTQCYSPELKNILNYIERQHKKDVATSVRS